MLLMGKSTISMAIFNSFLYVYESLKKGRILKLTDLDVFFQAEFSQIDLPQFECCRQNLRAGC